MRNLLLITYYWPPSGGVGVQRWLKLTKYLPEFGWRPIILTPENPAFDIQDPTLVKQVHAEVEVHKTPIIEPFHLLKKLSKNNSKANYGVGAEGSGKLQWLLNWSRGNLFIPDPRRFWVRPATKYAASIIENNNIDLVVTTGPPHSMHLIGQQLKKQLGICWLADFRDPWSEWDVLRRMHSSDFALNRHKKLELSVLRQADMVISATESLSNSLQEIAGRPVHTITNGIDFDSLPSKRIAKHTAHSGRFTILYAGLMNASRNPNVLWDALAELCSANQEFADALEVNLYGTISNTVTPENTHPILQNKIHRKQAISIERIREEYLGASVLLLTVDQVESGKVYLPVKMFDYLAAERPVLSIGYPDSELANVIAEQKVGTTVAFDNLKGTIKFLNGLFAEFKIGSNLNRPNNYEKFSSRKLANKLANQFNELMPL